MKLTITFIALLSVTTSWAEKDKKLEEAKDKREAPLGYPSSSHGYQSQGNEGASAISIGAGYSVGGAKPSYSGYDIQGYSASPSLSSDGLSPSAHAMIQLAPITLQPSHGNLIGTDLNQLLSQLQHSLNSGALTLQAPGGYENSYQPQAQSSYAGQDQPLQQLSYGAPKLQQYNVAEQPQSSPPSYASGTKGLGSYSSSGPVLFNPSDAQPITPTLNYAPSAGHSFGSSGGISLGSAGHSLAGHSGSFGGSQFASAQLLSSPYKSFGSSYASSGKNTFKPSAYIGSSVQSDSSHGVSALSGSYGTPSLSGSHGGLSLGSGSHGGLSFGSGSYVGQSLGSSSLGGHSLGAGSFGGHSPSYDSFGGHSLSSGGHGGHSLGSGLSGISLSSGGHGSQGGLSLGSDGYGASFGGSHGGFGGGASKYISNAYLPAKSGGFGSLSSYASALSSPPGTSYGIPTATYGLPATASHAASSHSPQYYVSKSPSHSSFGSGSSSYKSPSSSHSSLKSYPKYSSGGYSSSSSYDSPKDSIQGAYSENSYNTIKYSQELKASSQ